MRRTVLLTIISIGVSLGILFLVLQEIPFEGVIEALQEARFGWVGVLLVIFALSLWVRGIRWRGLLDNRISANDAFYLMGVTFMLNQLPLRAGEVARSLVVTQRGVPFMTAATSIIVERLLDVLAVVLMITVSIAFLPNVPATVTNGAIIFGVIGVVGFIILLAFAHYPILGQSILAIVFKILPFMKRLPLESWLTQVIDGLQPLTNWGMLVHALVWTGISWGLSWFGFWVAMQSLTITENAILGAALATALASLSIAVPLSIASIGLLEGAVILAGDLVGIPIVQATALGFLYHGLSVFIYIVVGVIGIWLLGVSLKDIFNQDIQSPLITRTTR